MSKETTQPGTPISLTFEQLKELLASAQKQPNIVEQKAIEAEIQREKNKALAVRELGKVEEERLRHKRSSCTHYRFPMTAGERGGHMAPRERGESMLSGQLHSQKLATAICCRCSMTWTFRPTEQEYEYFSTQGMKGIDIPDPSRVIASSVAGV